MYIVIAILAFGILIATHELGHFATAKLCGIRVNEFAIGMGPAFFKRQKGETLYSLRVLPIGGFCAMEGEDGESEDTRAFVNQALWKRLIVLVAGAFMNFLVGFLIVVLLFSGASAFATNQIAELADDFPYTGEEGLMPGDRILEIDGMRIYYPSNFSQYAARAGGSADILIERDGEEILLEDFPLETRAYTDENGETVYRYGITFGTEAATFGSKLAYSWNTTKDFVRMVWVGLSDLVTGRAGLGDMSGVVGIVSTINQVGEASESSRAALENIAYLFAFIAVNLAVVNLLPIPALDGGRVFFLLVNGLITLITKKKVNPKYEGYIHAVGLVLLMGLMVVVLFNDVLRIVRG